MRLVNEAEEHIAIEPTTTSESCDDQRRVMPLCEQCIVDLAKNYETDECSMTETTRKLRSHMAAIAKERYGGGDGKLYPYLSKEPFIERQRLVGMWLSRDRPKRILDIGTYTNPLWKYISDDFCPELIASIEPLGELITKADPWESKMIPCKSSNIHSLVIPSTVQEYVKSAHIGEAGYDAAVCIGCDGSFGPRMSDFANLLKPFHLYLEVPLAYGPSKAAFSLPSVQVLCGANTQPEDEHTFNFDSARNETSFTERYLAHYICS